MSSSYPPRASRFRTVVRCHWPPRAVLIPRAFSASAIARSPCTPLASSCRMIGSTFAANASSTARFSGSAPAMISRQRPDEAGRRVRPPDRACRASGRRNGQTWQRYVHTIVASPARPAPRSDFGTEGTARGPDRGTGVSRGRCLKEVRSKTAA
jgi:hypothetical protein